MDKPQLSISRREFAIRSAAGIGALYLPFGCAPGSSPRKHPFMYVTDEGSGLRTLTDVSSAIGSGHSKFLWEGILATADTEVGNEPLLASSMVQGRDAVQAQMNNLDFVITDAVGKRITRNGLAYLLTGDEKYKQTAWLQLETIFDHDRFPNWIDQAHLQFNHPVGLRTGMLAFDAALGFDWLYNGLTDEQQMYVREGIDRRAMQPFLVSMGQDPWWMHDLNNWMTTICGGIGVCAMIVADHHPDSEEIIRIADESMNTYLSTYGPNGEFNENPAYANATLRPAEYFMAKRYWTGGKSHRLAEHPFPETCHWIKYLTLPPGRTADFGDTKIGAKPWTKYVAAVAAATKDSVLQKYYLDHHRGDTGDPVELLWYDATLNPVEHDPSPLARVFPGYGGCVISRTSWDSASTECVVYGKASREDNHEHHDAGTVCIDGFGERLIVDLGSPSGYPADFFEKERWSYYNAGIVGHNVLMFDEKEMVLPDWQRGDGPKKNLENITGRIVDYSFDNHLGGWWKMDLTRAYHDVESLSRTVLHLHPGFVAVIDEAALPFEQAISLRWHTVDKSAPDGDGTFVVAGDACSLACKIVDLAGAGASFRRREHSYKAPFNRSRDGQLLEQRRESYVEMTVKDSRCKVLSLFALSDGNVPAHRWLPGGINIFKSNTVTCRVGTDRIELYDSVDGRTVSVALGLDD